MIERVGNNQLETLLTIFTQSYILGYISELYSTIQSYTLNVFESFGTDINHSNIKINQQLIC